MKKIITFLLVICSIFCLVGCNSEIKPSNKIEYFLNRYINNDKEIIEELNIYLENEDLTDEQIERYKNIIKNEYQTLEYNIKNETVDKNKGQVDVEISVIDLYKASMLASEYLKENPNEFYTEGRFDQNKFIDYKLKVMENYKEKVNYLITFTLTKKDNVWVLDDISDENLEKIHGIYDYESVE